MCSAPLAGQDARAAALRRLRIVHRKGICDIVHFFEHLIQPFDDLELRRAPNRAPRRESTRAVALLWIGANGDGLSTEHLTRGFLNLIERPVVNLSEPRRSFDEAPHEESRGKCSIRCSTECAAAQPPLPAASSARHRRPPAHPNQQTNDRRNQAYRRA